MKKNLLTLIACGVLLVGVTGCGSNDSTSDGGSGSSSASLYKTMTISELNTELNSDTTSINNYIGKKIKVTNALVTASKSMSEDKLVTVSIYCSNSDSLGIQEGDVVSVTGLVGSDSSSYIMYLSDCTIEK